MPFVDLLRFKNYSTDYMSQKISEKIRRKKIRENISKKLAEKIPKSLKFGKKNPRTREKLPGFFLIPKIFVRFFQSNLPLDSKHNLVHIYTQKTALGPTEYTNVDMRNYFQ